MPSWPWCMEKPESGTYFAPTVYLPMFPCIAEPSVLSPGRVAEAWDARLAAEVGRAALVHAEGAKAAVVLGPTAPIIQFLPGWRRVPVSAFERADL